MGACAAASVIARVFLDARVVRLVELVFVTLEAGGRRSALASSARLGPASGGSSSSAHGCLIVATLRGNEAVVVFIQAKGDRRAWVPVRLEARPGHEELVHVSGKGGRASRG